MQTQDVELGFLATPDRGPCPGVVLIHDVWGLTDHARDLTRRLSGEGFAVLGLELYRRLDALKIENPGAWMRALSDPQILGDVQAGVDFLAAHALCRGRRIGVIGFCMGGMYALMAGATCKGLSASVPFYGLLSARAVSIAPSSRRSRSSSRASCAVRRSRSTETATSSCRCPTSRR